MKICVYILTVTFLLLFESADAQDLGFDWFRLHGGEGRTEGTSIFSDTEGNLYIGGHFEKEIEIDGESFLSAGGKDMLLMKLYPDGGVDWIKSIGGKYDDYISDINFYDNKLVIAGTFSDTITIEDTFMTADEFGDLFIAQFSSDGNLIDFHSESGNGGIHVNELEIDVNGNFYVTGRFNGQLNIGSLEFNASVWYDHNPWTNDSTIRYNENMFLIKFDPDFRAQWAKHYTQGLRSDWEEGLAIEVDDNENVYFTSFLRDQPIEIEGNQINEWLFLTKLDPNGRLDWYVDAGPTRNVARAQSLLLDRDAVYVGGQVAGTDIRIADSIVTKDADYAAFLTKFDTKGSLLWFTQLGDGSLSDPHTDYNSIYSIKAYQDTIFVGGHFMGKITEESANIHLEGSGSHDLFIAKISTNGGVLDAGQRVVQGWSCVNDLIVNDNGIFFTGFSFEGYTSSAEPSYLAAGKIDQGSGLLNNDIIVLSFEDELIVYPNPLKGNELFINNQDEKGFNLKVFDINGRLLIEQGIESHKIINLPDIDPGIYFVCFNFNGESFVRRFVKL